MTRAVTALLALVVALGAWLVPGNALACTAPPGANQVEVGPAAEEATPPPAEISLQFWYIAGPEHEQHIRAVDIPTLHFDDDGHTDAPYALAALAPVIFALLTVGLYAAVQRRG